MAASIQSPYYEGAGGVWLKGNLHAHTTRSDGVLGPQETIEKYRALWYDFLMLSDHDTLGEPEKLDGGGMLLLRGNEISAGGPSPAARGGEQAGRAGRGPPAGDRRGNADGGLAILCHPNWQEHFNHCTYETLIALKGYAGIEILNGTCLRLAGEARATDKWDRVLATGRMIWGYGTDDMHKDYEQGLAWTVVRARERTAGAVVEALKAGSCYASSGVEIQQVKVTGSVLHVFAPTAQAMAVFGDYGARLHYQLGNEVYFDVAELRALVRAGGVLRDGRANGVDAAVRHPRGQGGAPAPVGRGEAGAAGEAGSGGTEADGPDGRSGVGEGPAFDAVPGHEGRRAGEGGDERASAWSAGGTCWSGVRCGEPQMGQLKTNVTR